MAKLLDSEGKLWALMSSKDKAGRIYIRAYRNRWDSVKKRSFVESKVQVGRSARRRFHPAFKELC